MAINSLIIWGAILIFLIFAFALFYYFFSGSLISISRRGMARTRRESSLLNSMSRDTRGIESYFQGLHPKSSSSLIKKDPLQLKHSGSKPAPPLPLDDSPLQDYLSKLLVKTNKIERLLKKDEEELRKILYLIRGYESINDKKIQAFIITIKTLINTNLGQIKKTTIAISAGRKLIFSINSEDKSFNSFKMLVSIMQTISYLNQKRNMGDIIMLSTQITARAKQVAQEQKRAAA